MSNAHCDEPRRRPGVDIQLKILQTLLALIAKYLELHDALPGNLVMVVMNKMVNEDRKNVDAGTQDIDNNLTDVTLPDGTTTRLNPSAKESYPMFEDLCLWVKSEKSNFLKLEFLHKNPRWSRLKACSRITWVISKVVLLENHAFCPIFFKALSDRPTFPLILRCTRVVFLPLKQFSLELQTEAEVFLMLLIRIITDDNSVSLEASGSGNSYAVTQSLWDRLQISGVGVSSSSDNHSHHTISPSGSTYSLDGIAGMVATAASATVSNVIGMMGSNAGLSLQSSTMKLQCIDQLDNANKPSAPEFYFYLLAIFEFILLPADDPSTKQLKIVRDIIESNWAALLAAFGRTFFGICLESITGDNAYCNASKSLEDRAFKCFVDALCKLSAEMTGMQAGSGDGAGVGGYCREWEFIRPIDEELAGFISHGHWPLECSTTFLSQSLATCAKNARKRGRPKGTKPFTQYLPRTEDKVSKRPVGRPRGSGYRQQARKEIERQRRDNPPSYSGVGLTHTNTSTLSLSSSSSPSPSSSSQVYQSDHNAEVPNSTSTISSNVLPANNILERAQRAASLTNNKNDPEVVELPHLPNPADSFLHLIDLDEDQIIENSFDSLTAEGIGDDDMDAGEDDEDDSDEYVKDDESLEAFEDEATSDSGTASEQGQKKRPERRPYPAWFRTQLATAMEQLKTDRRSLSGQSHSYQSGAFWLPTKSTWSILQKQNIRPNDLFVPKFFFWDPESLLSVGIACPYCHKPLHRHAFLPRPRRIIDIDCSFWIIGCSYRCRDCKKAFRSWDRRILANIPQPLAAEFPAYLTWRNGLSLRALGVLHSCIQSGMGAHQVASPCCASSNCFGRICAIDHSHKLAKHIAKVDGVPIFTALLTVTNDRGEIRVCNFVTTKSHSQFTDLYGESMW
ncbi:hypothetical protein EV360DRAFT_74483 [Lentinula raphanica]|nr:hypothetical protein EV360DRAFT_74483 [Lentinula raphanica]